MDDPHHLLGLEPGAPAHAIKRAFRRLAMRWHPDRNPDPAALEHFKALRAAYESLIAGVGGDEAAEAEAEAGARGADRRQALVLELEEAVLGCDKLVELADEAPCEACAGSGEEALRHTRLCAPCHGSGRLRREGGLVPCEACGGRGYRSRQACAACAGSGRRRTATTVAVKVPAGVREGDELRLAGKGEPCTAADGRPGDLLLRIVLAAHPLFRVDGRDLHLRRPTSALRLLLGGEVAVPVPGGVRTVRVSPGAAARREARIEGAGFPTRGPHPAGDLVVELEPVFPDAADEGVRALLERLEAELASDPARHLPELARWEARWLITPPAE